MYKLLCDLQYVIILQTIRALQEAISPISSSLKLETRLRCKLQEILPCVSAPLLLYACQKCGPFLIIGRLKFPCFIEIL